MALLSCKTESQVDELSISGRKLLVNNSQYIIKGICYHTVPKDSKNFSNFNNLSLDLALMYETGINNITVYAII